MTAAVSRETDQLNQFELMVRQENILHNLVSNSTLEDFAVRHIADGAQLVGLARPGSTWCDIGSGAGLPGIVIAILSGDPVTLVEPRRLRADFLIRVSRDLGLRNVSVIASRAERVVGRYDVITARAVAATDRIFAMAEHLAHSGTRWILPKGRSVKKELDAATQSWQGKFRLVPSKTSGDGLILVADEVRRKGKR